MNRTNGTLKTACMYVPVFTINNNNRTNGTHKTTYMYVPVFTINCGPPFVDDWLDHDLEHGVEPLFAVARRCASTVCRLYYL